jgi:hypothetical protein
MGSCAALVQINLPHNRLEGEIPKSITKLRRCRRLVVSGNLLTGQLPQELGQMAGLEKFIAYGNKYAARCMPSTEVAAVKPPRDRSSK